MLRRTKNNLIGIPVGLVAVLGVALFAGAAHAETRVSVQTVQQRRLQGDLAAFALNRGMVLKTSDSKESEIDIEQVVRLEFVREYLSPNDSRDDRVAIHMRNGDLLFGALQTGHTPERLTLSVPPLGTLNVPLESVAAIRWPGAGQPDVAREVKHTTRSSANPQRPAALSLEDIVTLTNGDQVKGFIDSISATNIAIESAGSQRRLGVSLVRDIQFAASGDEREQRLPSKYAVISLAGGHRLSVTAARLDDEIIRANWMPAGDVDIPLSRILSLDVFGGRWQWLSQLEPVSYEHTPAISLHWDFQRDRNVLGKPMTIAGEHFARGIGVHSRSVLTYELAGGYREFVTSLGLDDSAGPLADVDVAIRIGGRPVYRKEHLKSGQLEGPLRFPLNGAKRLELIVNFGANGDVQDRFNWADSALIR